MSSGRIISLATGEDRVWAGTDGRGLVMSVDRGQSWVRDVRFPSDKVRCLFVHEEIVYAGTDSDGVFVLKGKEQVWTRLGDSLPPQAQVFALSVADGRLFAGLYSQGLFVWGEQARRWTKTGPVSPLALSTSGRTLIAGHNPGGLFWSVDFGASWARGKDRTVDPVLSSWGDLSGELSEGAPVWEIAADDEVALAGVSQGIYRSLDHGRTWERVQEGLPANWPGVAFLVSRAVILAGVAIGSPDGRP